VSTAAEELLAAVVRGDATHWPPGGAVTERSFMEAAHAHGLQALVGRQLRKAGVLDTWPSAIRHGLQRTAIQRAAVQQILDVEVVRVLDALAAAGAGALVIKGAALAHTHYSHPCLRPRTDTDLLIRETAVDVVVRVMLALGYARFNQVSGEVVRYQTAFVKSGLTGVRHFYDIHWRASERQRFSTLPGFDDIRPQAVAIPALGLHAYAPGTAQALILACVHRVAHHDDADEHLIWIYDIDRLARALSEDGRGELVRQAREQRVAAICARGLKLAERWFGTPAGELLAGLDAAREPAGDAYLGAPMRKIDVLVSDLKSLPGWRARGRLLREHLFPPPAYMLEHYGLHSTALLPAYYLRRLLAGLGPWFRQPGRSGTGWE
jgi:hypothetical protein